MVEVNKSRVEVPHSFYVSTGESSKTIKRLGNFDKPSEIVLELENLDSISFNYFVQWDKGFRDGSIVQEAWIKVMK